MVALESVAEIGQKYQRQLDIAEWFITLIFSVEYILRIFSIKKPSRYIFSVYGIIDFISIASFLSLSNARIGGAFAGGGNVQ